MTKEKTPKIESNWFLPVQATLLVLHYGAIVILPWWVVWFPSMIYTVILIVVLVFSAILLGVSAAIDKMNERKYKRKSFEDFMKKK
jgi:amino acid transporter